MKFYAVRHNGKVFPVGKWETSQLAFQLGFQAEDKTGAVVIVLGENPEEASDRLRRIYKHDRECLEASNVA